MKKVLFISLVLSLFFTACSSSQLDDELEEVVKEPTEEYNEPIEEDNEPTGEDNEPTEEDNEPTEEDNEPTEEDNELTVEYNEPIIFLEKHHMTVWERTDGSGKPDQIIYMRILKNPNKIAETWTLSDTDDNCYVKDFYNNLYYVVHVGETEDSFLMLGKDRETGFHVEYNFSVSNDTLSEHKDWMSPPPSVPDYSIWVKSKVNVDDLNLCDE